MSTYATRLCLSGLESRRLLDTFADFQVPHIQVSYYYLRKVFPDPQEFESYAKPFDTIIIDHGLIYHKYKSEPEKQQFLLDYQGYIAGLQKNTYFAVVAHSDLALDSIVDTSKLIFPLEELEELFEGDMKAVFSQVQYIGIGNKVATNEERMGFIASQAAKASSRLHAFGTSSIRVLKKWPFYTANSSSWRTGSRYANTYVYEGPSRGLKIHQPSDKSNLDRTDREKRQVRTKLKARVQARQSELIEKINWDSLFEDDSWEVDKANLTQWMLYSRDLEVDVGRNRYYLTDKDKELLRIRRDEMVQREKPDVDSSDTLSDSNSSPPVDNMEGEIVEGEAVQVTEPSLGEVVVSPAQDGPNNYRMKEVDPRVNTLRKCEDCILAGRCPKYMARADGLCSFGINDAYLPSQIDDHIDEDFGELLAVQRDRIMQAYLEEKVDAAGVSKDTHREIKLYMEMLQMWRDSKAEYLSAHIKAKGGGSTGLLQMFNKGGNKGGAK